MATPPIESITLLAHQVQALHEDFSEMRVVIKELATTMSRLVVMEERQAQASQSLERAFKVIEKIENRVEALEKDAPINTKVTGLIISGACGAVGVLVTVLLHKLGAL